MVILVDKRIFVSRDKVIFENTQTIYWFDEGSVWKGKRKGSKEYRQNQKISVAKNSVEKVETHCGERNNQGKKLVKILKRYKVKIQWHKTKVKP